MVSDSTNEYSYFTCRYTKIGVIPGRGYDENKNENRKSFVCCIDPSDNDIDERWSDSASAKESRRKAGSEPAPTYASPGKSRKVYREVKCCMSFGEEETDEEIPSID